jgi:transcriptional regulator with XRE-family HTH domain
MKTIYNPSYVTLVQKLIDLRKETKITQKQLANVLGKPQSYVAKVEGCERKLDVLELLDWCKALGKPASEYIQELEH